MTFYMSTVQPRTKSCDYCRQNRVRCDRIERAPLRCTRCQTRDLQCTFLQPSQSRLRVNKPRRVRQHEEINEHGADLARNSPHDSSRLPAECADASDTAEQPFQLSLYNGPSQQIGNVTVTAAEINEGFLYFFTRMHPNFPFLSPDLCIESTLQVSPLLFWTILAIASNFRDQTRYRGLQREVRKLVGEVLYPTGHSLETCQAICLSCLWPFEATEPNDNPQYLYSGLVCHLAMRMGLHRPEFLQEFKNIDERELRHHQSSFERWRTWCACQFVELHLASKTGVPSGIRQNWASQSKLEKADGSRKPALSPIIKHHLLLGELRDRYVNAIAYDGQTVSGMAPPAVRIIHLKLFSAALDTFEAAHSPLDTLSSILLQATRVTLSSFFLASDIQESLSSESYIFIQHGIISASTVLNLVAPLAWETLPDHILRAVLYAGVYAAQLRRIAPSPVPSEQFMPIIERATDILRHLAFGNDLPTRGKIILETQLRDFPRDFSSTHARRGVVVQARMGANMFWDLVESERGKHNWNQNEKDIFWELLESDASAI